MTEEINHGYDGGLMPNYSAIARFSTIRRRRRIGRRSTAPVRRPRSRSTRASLSRHDRDEPARRGDAGVERPLRGCRQRRYLGIPVKPNTRPPRPVLLRERRARADGVDHRRHRERRRQDHLRQRTGVGPDAVVEAIRVHAVDRHCRADGERPLALDSASGTCGSIARRVDVRDRDGSRRRRDAARRARCCIRPPTRHRARTRTTSPSASRST